MQNLRQAVESGTWEHAYKLASDSYTRYLNQYAASGSLDDLNAAKAFELIRDSIKSTLEELG